MKREKDLTVKGIDFELIPLTQAVHTVHDVQVACGCKTSEVIKTLVFIGDNPITIIMPRNKIVDLSKIKEITKEQKTKNGKAVRSIDAHKL